MDFAGTVEMSTFAIERIELCGGAVTVPVADHHAVLSAAGPILTTARVVDFRSEGISFAEVLVVLRAAGGHRFLAKVAACDFSADIALLCGIDSPLGPSWGEFRLETWPLELSCRRLPKRSDAPVEMYSPRRGWLDAHARWSRLEGKWSLGELGQGLAGSPVMHGRCWIGIVGSCGKRAQLCKPAAATISFEEDHDDCY